ncbi:FxsA family protein [Patulibacter sp.]|uniref:FxsA family protein n=1 Tax=Patulibacter sp. TaxID=1912859 RepID=UPI002717C488|nr:FxsA family protein [Patulibacter sp.]MDO9407557.1 FxsA family protein [Patulibacter sp.]
MPLLLLALLLGGAVLEIWVALQVADAIGALPVLALLVLSAGIGVRVLGRGTVRAWRRVADASRSGERVGRSVLDAGLVVVAGVLLLLPGLVSGVLGLLLLAPPVRAVLRPILGGLVVRRVALPFVVGAKGASWAAGRRPGAPVDLEGHATERRGPADPEGPVSGVVLPAPPEHRGPGAL